MSMKNPNLKELQSTGCMRLLYIVRQTAKPSETTVFTSVISSGPLTIEAGPSVISSPNVKFGLAFSEASGECLVRVEGNDDQLIKKAADNSINLSCGHSFIILIRGAYPINILTQLKIVPEVCTIYAATANPLEVIIAETKQGRGILGVIDGQTPLGIEDEKGVKWRKEILRKLKYKT